MISLGARSIPKSASQLPFHSEPVAGSLTIRARQGLKLTALSGPAQNGGHEIPTTYQNGRYHIMLEPKLGTYWLQLR